jgi:hypothetical protein
MVAVQVFLSSLVEEANGVSDAVGIGAGNTTNGGVGVDKAFFVTNY